MPCRHQSHASSDPIARRAFTISLHLHILHLQITGMLENTGHSVLFRIDTNSSQAYDDSRLAINITGGPLSYRYRFDEMHIHYGLHDSYGSEHSVQGYTFPAEVSCWDDVVSSQLDSSCRRLCASETHTHTGFNELTIVFLSLMLSISCVFFFWMTFTVDIATIVRLQFAAVFEFHGFIESTARNCWHFRIASGKRHG